MIGIGPQKYSAMTLKKARFFSGILLSPYFLRRSCASFSVNPFADVLGNIKKLVKGSEANAIGIDIGSSAIKVVEVKKRGGKKPPPKHY